MYNPCATCLDLFGHSYTKECEETCEYANLVNQIRQLGGITELTEIVNGDRFPLVFVDGKHIDSTYKIVYAAKNKII